ncbi:Fc.00g054850.m01.CDS01 [Cosmosporella sp. VM-42]
MPSVSPETLRTLECLTKEHRIEFLNELSQEEWPDCHQGLRNDTRKLAETRFTSYASSLQTTEDEPWKLEVKSVAKKLVGRAVRCKQRNESSWRAACEHVVFSRLSAEVACRKCRNRIWRSEIEAKRSDKSGASTALTHRQQNREPCRCPRQERLQDYLEAVGVNQVFGHREDETVRLDKAVSKRLSKEIQKPDKVFGLRQTRNIENLLHDTIKTPPQSREEPEPAQVHELLSQPLSQNGDPILFPFLIMEAKSGTSATDWHSIQLQTAFPIRTFLEAQHHLRTTSGDLSHRQLEPLVWFLSNKGEDWRLSIAYTRNGTPKSGTVGEIDYRVVDVWSGSIATLDGAIQLLLLVDYIFDWARDIYREDVIRHLRAIASGENDAATVTCSDTDVFSTRQPFRKETTVLREDEESYQFYMKRFAPRYYDDQLQCRPANYVESRYCCLFITRDNIRTLLDSLSDTRKKTLFGFIAHGNTKWLHLDLETTYAMEKQWTGNTRNLSAQPPSTVFYTAVSCTSYISSDWNLTRELYTVAVENDDRVIRELKIQTWRLSCHQVPQDTMVSTLRRLQAGSPADILLDAITRRCVTLEHIKTVNTIDLTSSEVAAAGRTPLIEPIDNDGKIRHSVHEIYETFKKGIIEPEETFLRISKRHGLQDRLHLGVPRFQIPEKTPLRISGSGCIWVYALGPKISHPTPNICLYFVQDIPTTVTSAKLEHCAVSTFESQDVYHTIRSYWVAKRLRAFVGQFPWNLKSTYGVSTQALKNFPTSIRQPTSQGWLNPSAGSGRFMYERNLSPWQDPRDKSLPDPEKLFICYKLIREGLTYWREVAEGQASHGIPCCKICAFVGRDGIGSDGICEVCVNAMADPARPSWFRDLIRRVTLTVGNHYTETVHSNVSNQGVEIETEKDENVDLVKSFHMLDEGFSDLRDLRRQQERFHYWVGCRASTRSPKRQRLE